MNMDDDSFDIERAIGALWGKSTDYGSTRPHLLLQHLYDTLAVGELVWDEYLGDPVRVALDNASGGRGRNFFAFLCGIHDVGKATPKFQAKVATLAARVKEVGLNWRGPMPIGREWHHTLAGAHIVRTECSDAGWDRRSVAWVWPLVGGHHGRVPSSSMTKPQNAEFHGATPEWRAVQRRILEHVSHAAGFASLAAAAPEGQRPPVGTQLVVSGAIIMADWLASNPGKLPPIDDPQVVGVDAARRRARQGWLEFDLRSGISPHEVPEDVVQARFGYAARPLQTLAVRQARAMSAPGLVLIEAPMGEGKTEAALAAAEILIARFGLRGVFVGMPTQATSDSMFVRIHRWSETAAPGAPIMLLHGKAMVNTAFTDLRVTSQIGPTYEGIDTFGDTGDAYGIADREHSSAAVVDWFRGRKRGLLAPLGIGTIDNLLHAATRTSHVMVRHAGLGQKVVILDEVHAATVYMSQFLHEALRWLASAGVPVIVLTATLPPAMRDSLVAAYASGANAGHIDQPRVVGYPAVTTVAVTDGVPQVRACVSDPWRVSVCVALDELMDDMDGAALSVTADSGGVRQTVSDDVFADVQAIADLLRRLLVDGGTALIIRNTVRRAQELYLALNAVFPDEVELLHARLTAGDRAARTSHEMDILGPSESGERPRHILVATQIAEQSFDVDADVLITDLAPIDLLVQRVGRIHRHERGPRPEPVARPRVVVTGMRWMNGAPEFPYAAKKIYGEWHLLRAAALVRAAKGTGWQFPADIAALVEIGYGSAPTEAEDLWPQRMSDAKVERDASDADRIANAEQFLLSVNREGPLPDDLRGLHQRSTAADDGDALDAVVRDGERSPEVVLIRQGSDGAEYTISGRKLSDGGSLTSDAAIIEEAIASLVRLPAGRTRGGTTLSEAVREIPEPSGWTDDPYLRFMKPLALDSEGCAEIGGRTFRYDRRLGLVEEPP